MSSREILTSFSPWKRHGLDMLGWSQGGKGRKQGKNHPWALHFVLTHTKNAAIGTSTLVPTHGSKCCMMRCHQTSLCNTSGPTSPL